jgi:hypothetical protein
MAQVAGSGTAATDTSPSTGPKGLEGLSKLAKLSIYVTCAVVCEG